MKRTKEQDNDENASASNEDMTGGDWDDNEGEGGNYDS